MLRTTISVSFRIQRNILTFAILPHDMTLILIYYLWGHLQKLPFGITFSESAYPISHETDLGISTTPYWVCQIPLFAEPCKGIHLLLGVSSQIGIMVILQISRYSWQLRPTEKQFSKVMSILLCPMQLSIQVSDYRCLLGKVWRNHQNVLLQWCFRFLLPGDPASFFMKGLWV